MPNYENEIRDAKNIYWWLWLSPLLLIFTFPVVSGVEGFLEETIGYGYSREIIAFTVLALGLPHLWLLIPAVIAKSEFIRWHARQAILFQGIQSLIVPVSRVLLPYSFDCLMLFVAGGMWIFLNAWGHSQAKQGDCALMRWFGHGQNLPLLLVDDTVPQPAVSADRVNALVETACYSRDQTQRRTAMSELRNLGMVEEL